MAAPHPNQPIILPLDSSDATLALTGGKGANLARLIRGGFPVPPGFVITTCAYEAFVAANGIAAQAQALLPAESSDAALEAASQAIQGLFARGSLTPTLEAGIRAGYTALGRPAVAVRSSATAEDLPETSFAGQQDTYLNVMGEEALLQAVRACWASLWTARAIGYRLRNAIANTGLGLAVVVQEMVASQASGVLFTANPLTGVRGETVIDATLGLGEALVSGQVEPDHYVVTPSTGVISRTLGAKARSIRGLPGGGTERVDEAAAGVQALPDEAILDLARMGEQVERIFGVPQDIEWAWTGGQLCLLQARPITSLYPLPDGMAAEPLKVLFSFAAVQGMLDPMTPLGLDLIRQIFATAAAHLFGLPVTRQTQTALYTAGERLWVNLSSLLRNPAGRPAVRVGFTFGDPASLPVLQTLLADPRLQPSDRRLRLRTALRLARFFLPVAGNVLLNLLAPNRRRRQIVAQGEQVLTNMQAAVAGLTGNRRERLLALQRQLVDVLDARLPGLFVRFVSLIAAGMASLNLLNRLAGALPGDASEPASLGWHTLVLEITRGLPDNPTTEMDLALWQAARVIREDPASSQVFREQDAVGLASLYQAHRLPPAAQEALDRFLRRYGGRGLAEIDAGRPRWSEEPAHVLEAVGSYLQIGDPAQAPDAVFARGAASAAAAVDRLAARVRQTRGGRLKAPLVRLAAGRARALFGARESPKFFAVRLLALFRQALLALGDEFARAGELERADDLVFLDLSELADFARDPAQDWKDRIALRRSVYHRELLRRQVPRLLLSDGRAFYEGILAPPGAAGTLSGSPVSPGTAEGRVRVVLDPRQANLQPGEILVCQGTDPSWTPLFLTAAGLIMEVGGMMTHGAVVAREYGIPAIVGLDQATRRLHTGQRVRMDGSTGQITLVDT